MVCQINHVSQATVTAVSTASGLSVYSSSPYIANPSPLDTVVLPDVELFFSYGAHHNAFLAAEYGFTLPGNTHACVDVTEKVISYFEGLLADVADESQHKLGLLRARGFGA